MTAGRVVAVVVGMALLAACGRSAPEEGATTLAASISPSTTAAAITTAPATVAPPTTTPEYIVQEGDSLSIIAQRFGVSTEDLANFNGIENANDIQVGQTLTIPPTTTPPTTVAE